LAGSVAAKEPDKTVTWIDNLEDGQQRAVADGKPLVIRVGADWCPACRRQAEEILKPEVQAELARWTPVYLDIAAVEAEAAELGVSSIPAMRLRTPGGDWVSSRDGLLEAEDLVRWLKKQYEAAQARPDDVLLGTGKPAPEAIPRLVEQFGQRSPAIRGAAVRRLLPYAGDARPAVVKAFSEGSLAQRLSALELLEQWRAPLAGLDPWQPETFTSERLAALTAWSRRPPQPKSAPAAPTPEQLAAARRDVERMLRAPAGEAEAIAERLAGLGAALGPEVAARLRDATADQDRQRLLMLRYRLVAADSLALRWPRGLSRLAASNPRERQQAAEELAKLAGGDDRALLVELFSDPDPLVREISLRGLQNIGGHEATATLVKLLADPESNVRAAVLKQLEQQPDPAMVPKVVEYLAAEKDPDLVVHGIRFLRMAGTPAALKAMASLLKHESWQVRAEAAEGLTKAHYSQFEFMRGGSEASQKLQADVYAALIELLDDPDAFVVSRAVQGLADADLDLALRPMVAAARKHPDLAPGILPMLVHGDKMKPQAAVELRKFFEHRDAPVRAAALKALAQAAGEGAETEVLAGIRDPDVKVRITAADVTFELLEARREKFGSERRSVSARWRGPDWDATFQVDDAPRPPQSFMGSVLGALGLGAPAPLPVKKPVAVAEKPDDVKKPVAPAETPDDVKKPVAPAKQPDAPVKPPVQTTTDHGPRTTDTKTPAAPAEKPAVASEKPAAVAEKAEPPAEDPWDEWLRECYAGKHRPAWMAQLVEPLEHMLRSQDLDERAAAARVLVPLGRSATALAVLDDLTRSSPKTRGVMISLLPWLPWDQRLARFEQLRAAPEHEEGFRHSLIWTMAQVPDPRAVDLYWKILAEPKTTDEQASAIESALLQIHGLNSWSSDGRERRTASARALAAAAKQHAAAGSELERVTALVLLVRADPDAARELAEKFESDASLSPALRTDAFKMLLCLGPKKDATRRAVAALESKEKGRPALAVEYLAHGSPGRIQRVRQFWIPYVSSSESRTSGQALVFPPPEGLRPEPLRPLLSDPEPQVAAGAGYLLALLGESEGLDVLLRHAKTLKKEDHAWRELVVRAIAALNDSSHINVLREIYGELDRGEVSEFYWTIRSMTGPEILRFRKQIRDEVGMSNLR
jgi:HEAT repeat protein/thiol-disulfide isomerase/thioredoxin